MSFDILDAKQILEDIGPKISQLSKEIIELEKTGLRKFRVTQHTISPFLVNSSGIKEAVFKDNGFCVGDDRLFYDSYADKALGDVMLKENDAMVFFKERGYFYVSKKDDYENYLNNEVLSKSKRQERYDLSCRYGKIEEQIENYEFWEQYSIPFKFSSEIKVVLSGLSERSAGNGCSKATVRHIVLLEDLTDRKLRRKSGQFLCSQPTGIVKHFDDRESALDEIQERITCRECLRKLEKHKSNILSGEYK